MKFLSHLKQVISFPSADFMLTKQRSGCNQVSCGTCQKREDVQGTDPKC